MYPIVVGYIYKCQTAQAYIAINIGFFSHFCLGMLAIDSG